VPLQKASQRRLHRIKLSLCVSVTIDENGVGVFIRKVYKNK
jgi:hypothetical protein